MDSTNSCTTSDLVDRIKKEEILIEEWDQCSKIDSNDILMKYDQQGAEVKVEKLESEIHKDMDTLDPITGVFLPNTSDNVSRHDMVLDGIKTEDVKTEKLGDSDFSTNFMEDKKLQKEDIAKMMPGRDSAETYPMQLTEELDIKNETGASSDEALESRLGGRNLLSCYNCEYITRYKSNLINHMTTHRRLPLLEFSCTQCDSLYYSERERDCHMIRNHPNSMGSISNEIFECYECAYNTTRQDDFESHILKHPGLGSSQKPIPCAFRCILCNILYRQKFNLDNHIIKTHPDFIALVTSKIYECPKCSYKTTKGRHYLDSHIIQNHPDLTTSVSSRMYECQQCTYKTAMKHRFSRHVAAHSEASAKHFTCMVCNRTYKNKSTLDDHVIKDHPDYILLISRKILECKMCTFKTTKGKLFLDEHITKKHPDSIELVTSKLYVCNLCPFKTTKQCKLSRHVLKHTGEMSSYEECTYCSGIYKSKSTLHDHIVKNHPNSTVPLYRKVEQCTICSFKTTKSKTALDDHIIKHHPDFVGSVSSKTYECKQCSFKTVYKYLLSKHTLKHAETSRYACLHCDQVCTTERILENHMFRMHPNSFAPLSTEIQECSKCDFKTIKVKAWLDDHMIDKHPECISSITSEIYPCKHCSYRTTIKSKLKEHELEHSEGVPKNFECLKCNKSYRRKKTLNEHVVKKHLNTMSPESSKL